MVVKSESLLISPLTPLVLFFLTALYPVNVRSLFGFSFADVGRFTGHVAWVKMELSRLLFTRLLLVWIPVVGHGTLLLTLTITASNEPGSFSARRARLSNRSQPKTKESRVGRLV
jgi:hypothetical protein